MRREPARSRVFRLPRKLGPEAIIIHGANVAAILLGLAAIIAALHFGRTVLVPVTVAIVIGLMLGPIADRLERWKIRPPLSSAIVTFLFLIVLVGCIAGFAVPLGDWVERLPLIWQRMRAILADWRGIMETASSLSEEMHKLTGDGDKVSVTIDEGNPATEIAILAPEIIGQCLIFLASLYFFLSTRHDIRKSVLRLCMSRRVRWRTAHIFRDAEVLVSRYLISITCINVCLGIAVALAMYVAGVPSPLLWGLLAAGLNYVPYIGPAIMIVILLCVGLAAYSTLSLIIMPSLIFMFFNFIEAQFITPHVLGRNLTINPFVVFLALVFWLWIWGPAGGFVAVPLLLIAWAAASHMLPLVAVSETA